MMFEDARFRYGYEDGIHKVKVTPIFFFWNNANYIKKEALFEKRFLDRFPDENIIFISEDSLTELHSPEFDLSIMGGINGNVTGEEMRMNTWKNPNN